MDSNHPILSHQQSLAASLSNEFNSIYVLTGNSSIVNKPANMTIISTGWQEGQNFRNVFRFLIKFLDIMRNNNVDVIYSHMTTFQSLIISPFTWIARKKHFLWYAHKSRPFVLNIVYLFISGILTSTPGSFPFRGKKIHAIGQGIDVQIFPPYLHRDYQTLNFVHFGRFDESKNLFGIIYSLQKFKARYSKLTLTIIGTPARPESRKYKQQIQDYINNNDMNEWVVIRDSIPRALLSSETKRFNVFIHNFRGSLDKTLLEATAMCLDVITTNLEYINEFGSWSKRIKPELQDEIDAYFESSYEYKLSLQDKRSKLVTEKHSYTLWVKKTCEILKSNVISFGENISI